MRLLSLTLLLLLAVSAGVAAASVPTTGRAVPAGMERWDAAALQTMERFRLPAGSLSVAVDGRVVIERGYGYADQASGTPAQPTSAYRLASVSKPITAVAVAQALRARKLTLATRPLAGLPTADPRTATVTIEQLLNHRGGWDLEQLGYDPLFRDAGDTCASAIRRQILQPLSFAPGSRDAYSNFGYCVLADAIARATAKSWPAALQQLVFDPLKMRSTSVTPADLTARAPGEVTYYGQRGEDPYGLSLNASDGAARVVSTAPDLQRFLLGVSGKRPKVARLATKRFGHYPPFARGGVSWAFNGSLPGTSTTIGIEGPVTYVFLTSSRDPQDPPDYAALRDAARATARQQGR